MQILYRRDLRLSGVLPRVACRKLPLGQCTSSPATRGYTVNSTSTSLAFHRVSRPVVHLAVLAPVTRRSLYARLNQQLLNARFSPRRSPGGVLVEEVPPGVYLLLVGFAHEPQVHHGAYPLTVCYARITFGSVQ